MPYSAFATSLAMSTTERISVASMAGSILKCRHKNTPNRNSG